MTAREDVEVSEPEPGPEPARPAPPGPLVPAAVLAFVGSGCLLVLELVAARVIAPDLGVSLYTWTSVIGVVLMGVSLGNYLGGRFADRWPGTSLLSLVYLLASAATVAVLGVLPYLDTIELPNDSPPMAQVLWVVAVLFLVPSTLLGMPTPILTRLSMRSIDESGRVVGRIQAVATVGSIVGVFLTGFVLISAFGSKAIILGVACVLLVLALLARSPLFRRRGPWLVGPLVGVLVATGVHVKPLCQTESDYYCIRVEPGFLVGVDEAGNLARYQPNEQDLHLDALLHSEIDLSDPTNLRYGYEQQYASVVRATTAQDAPIDAFAIGGGGFAFPRYLDVTHPGSVTVAEVDPEVTHTAIDELGLQVSPRMHIVTGDARVALDDTDASFDLVLGDAFNDFGVPFHLTTREFNDLVLSKLRPEGRYLLNVVDAENYDLLRSVVRTMKATFPEVDVVVDSTNWPLSSERSTFVIVGSRVPLPPGSRLALARDQLDAFLADGRSELLTDDHAPVEQLIAPVFAQALQRER